MTSCCCPHNQRIVLEVDGSQHCARDHAPATYAAMGSADRDLGLGGYEVYRFGHDHLRDETTAQTLLWAFPPGLFQHHKITGRHSAGKRRGFAAVPGAGCERCRRISVRLMPMPNPAASPARVCPMRGWTRVSRD
ncbi:hypothetical protein GTY86_38130 [Streptomyces sp. SID5770]|uniref:hypothetical protein n=1 Tax=Streptomyces sp. SID5770 TaxID=2690308 RepID=UPI0013695056|nr:hypothetical protein [Streptomyces sp. SID5770]MZE56987.1 hypothetical protein [Streptomyces sp. SID5770]